MSPVKLKDVLELLKEFCRLEKRKLEVIVLGGLALHHYGMPGRATRDLDAEVAGDIESLTSFLKSRGVPCDLGEDVSRWSIVSLPSGYRKRAQKIYRDKLLVVKVLHPADFIIAKLRRFTEQDISDALFIAKKYKVSGRELAGARKDAISNSPKDTSLRTFDKNVSWFIEKLG